ncbi:MAG: hypothetical protein K8F91_17160, partial [Candidatus Obscuribacterales bacterium]|nr:hypothetical protein [Candidatus Obscuribacterales bacterium]
MKRLILISTLAVLGLNLELGLFPHRVDANETAANETAASKTATAGTQLSPTAVIEALEKELKRSFSKLEKAGKVPLYFLAYRLYEGNWEHIAAKDGALEQRKPAEAWRM